MSKYSKEEYNQELVHFCKSCLSLRILQYNEQADYCDDCGSTRTTAMHISDWNRLYIQKYGESFLIRE